MSASASSRSRLRGCLTLRTLRPGRDAFVHQRLLEYGSACQQRAPSLRVGAPAATPSFFRRAVSQIVHQRLRELQPSASRRRPRPAAEPLAASAGGESDRGAPASEAAKAAARADAVEAAATATENLENAVVSEVAAAAAAAALLSLGSRSSRSRLLAPHTRARNSCVAPRRALASAAMLHQVCARCPRARAAPHRVLLVRLGRRRADAAGDAPPRPGEPVDRAGALRAADSGHVPQCRRLALGVPDARARDHQPRDAGGRSGAARGALLGRAARRRARRARDDDRARRAG